jgi:phosphate transport system permease protein
MKDFFKSGDFFIWLTGLGLGLSIVMICGLLVLIFINGSDYFWPKEIVKVTRNDGQIYLGQVTRTESVPQYNLPDSLKGNEYERMQLKVGNRDILGFDFIWIDEREIRSIEYPENVVVIERMEFGNFYGYTENIKVSNKIEITGRAQVIENIDSYLAAVSSIINEINDFDKTSVGSINYKIEQLRLDIRKIEYYSKDDDQKSREKIVLLQDQINKYNEEYQHIRRHVDSLSNIAKQFVLEVSTAAGQRRDISMMNIVRVYLPNEMSFFSKITFVFEKLWEFVFDEPRESNTEGGVFPALFGTVMMVLLMSFVVVPFGVLAALYLREYAKQGPLVRTVRIAVNNLAGVPSIVFGVFGLGFFIYFVGGTIDQLFYPERLPAPTWGTGGILWASLTLSLLTMPVVIVATEEALAAIPRGVREASLALGATKWQTVRRIILPAAAPGILTGLILAMARGAGEVAPLMITGVVKLAPTLPVDSNFPFFHLDRKFMHLGFHIYDVGFQSPNVEAAMPMVYMTTLLLIVIVVLLNITAMIIRARLRKKYKSSTF